MKKAYYTLILLISCLGLQSITAHANNNDNLYEQLCQLNKYWQNHNLDLPALQEEMSFESERELIQIHLQLVEQHLRTVDVADLTDAQKANRTEGLDILKTYHEKGIFPINTRHEYTIPYFIDDFNTACAVGHILRESGGVTLATEIANTVNYAYIEEMPYDKELGQWAEEMGFSTQELKWIQPAYSPVADVVVVKNEPNCGSTNGAIDITVNGSNFALNGYRWAEGINPNAATLSTDEDISDIPSGFYSIYLQGQDPFNPTGVYDLYQERIGLSDVEGPVINPTVTHKSCANNGGRIDLNIMNFANYDIRWYDYANNLLAENVTSLFNLEGSYTDFINDVPLPYNYRVEVTDASNCKTFQEFFVEIGNVGPYIPDWGTDVVGTATNTGSITIQYVYDNGGQTNAASTTTFLWNDGVTTLNRTNLEPGFYLLTVTDIEGCSATYSYIIEDLASTSTACIDESQIDPTAICTLIYLPVCGCNGVTYGNDCVAYYSGVTEWTQGECPTTTDCIDPSLIDPNTICATIYDPVCGCDGITYGNSCEAENWGGVTSWTQGECGATGCNEVANFSPDFQYGFGTDDIPQSQASMVFCFNDISTNSANIATWSWNFDNGQTSTQASPCEIAFDIVLNGVEITEPYEVCLTVVYANGCTASSCTELYLGGGEGCVNGDNINPNAICTEEYNPVCGCNGVTYDNPCYAENIGGVTSWTQGACGTTVVDPCMDLTNVNFGECEAIIGFGLVNGVCSLLSGCGSVGADGIDYADALYSTEAECMASCGVTTGCTYTDPINELTWIQGVIDNYNGTFGCDCDAQMTYACYNDQAVFLIGEGPNTQCNDFQTFVYDESGNLICTAGGFTGGDCWPDYQGIDDPQNTISVIWDCDANIIEIPLKLKVLLEGAYNGNGTMTTALNDAGVLPISNPYCGGIYYCDIGASNTNMPANVVDWIMIEARETLDSDEVIGQAGLLLSDGTIVAADGTSDITLALDGNKAYHIWIRHRNHLDIVTANTITPQTSALPIDFSTSSTTAYGTNQLKTTSDGYVVMFAGDFIGDGVIQVSDFDAWKTDPAQVNVYDQLDANLDGVVQVTDFDVWLPNKAKIGTAQQMLDE